jgi:RNA polymerase sigma factor (sigma-70 family)
MASSRPIAAGSPRALLGGASLRERLGLSRRARRGEQGAFEEIFREHHQEIYRYCLAILRNPADAEDALQSTMSAALRALPGEAREMELRPWLFRVAHNESISIVRARRERPLAGEPTTEQVGSAATELEDRDRLRTLVDDLKGLPERQRAALVMRELSGLAYGEIAAALGCAEGAARQSVYEARVALRSRAEGREMGCDEVRRAVSDGDGRRVRGRKLKSHLRACGGCADFTAAIDVRRHDLQALCPPLPIAAAGGILAGLGIGGAGAAGATTGVAAVGSGAAAVGGGVAAGASVKAATVVAAVVVAAGAADAAGIVELPGPVQVGGDAEREVAPATSAGGAVGQPEANATQSTRARRAEAKAAPPKLKRGDRREGRGGRSVDAPGRAKAGHDGRGRGKDHGGRGNGVGAGRPERAPSAPAVAGPPANPGSNGVGRPAAPPGKPPKQAPAQADGGGGGGKPPPAATGPPAPTPGPPAAPGAGKRKGGSPK